jgi:hypothetical protein
MHWQPEESPGPSRQARTEMLDARRLATTRGNRKALLCGAGFVLLGLALSTRLPLRAPEPGEGRIPDC